MNKKTVSTEYSSINEHGHGASFRFTMHPSMNGYYDFDITYISDDYDEECIGILMTRDDMRALSRLVDNVFYSFPDDDNFKD